MGASRKTIGYLMLILGFSLLVFNAVDPWNSLATRVGTVVNVAMWGLALLLCLLLRRATIEHYEQHGDDE